MCRIGLCWLGKFCSGGYPSDFFSHFSDAAHTIHPLAGLGVNLGFGDVTTLTDLLRGATSMGADVGEC